MSRKKNIKILGKIVDLLRKNGFEIESPYDVTNFFEDHCSHENLFDTGRFNDLLDDDV